MTGEPRGRFQSLSDEELQTWIAGLSDQIEDLLSHDPQLYLLQLQAALQEQSRRAAAEAQASARRTTRYSLAVAFAALAVALTGTVADYFGDKSWQDEQTELLTEIRDRLP